MRRRVNIDCGRLKRLPSKKSRIAEPVQPSSYLHWKLLFGWLAIILLDSLADFRFEYLYPVVMFLRSVYDSYKYQGLIFSLLFICLVVYLDLLCWTVMTGPWLFLGASSCVWVEIMRNTEHTVSYTALTLSMFFLYIEVSQRLHNLPLLNISRPFAAHCIGYPVVTMSFLIKHHITHVIRQRQQKRVAEENSFYFELLQKALPQEENKLLDDVVEEIGPAIVSSGEQKHKVSPKPAANSKPAQRTQATSFTKHGRFSSGTKSMEQKAASVTKPHPDQNSSSGATPPVANGDVVRPSSAGKVHLPTGKKQAAVKAVPRSEPPAPPTAAEKDKMKVALDSMQAEVKLERHARMEAELMISQLELEVKKLQADLHASCLQEEECSSRVDQLVSQERSHKNDLHRLRTESDNLQNKLARLSSGKQQDQATISDLEKRLKTESEMRQRLEAELRDHRNAVRSLWGEEEMQEMKDKLNAKESELEGVRRELKQWEKACDDLRKEVNSYQASIRALEKEKLQLKASLMDETRVKIELFTALSDARRKQHSFAEESRRKDVEITRLHQNLAEMLAIIPGPPPPTTGVSPLYPPTSTVTATPPPPPHTSSQH